MNNYCTFVNEQQWLFTKMPFLFMLKIIWRIPKVMQIHHAGMMNVDTKLNLDPEIISFYCESTDYKSLKRGSMWFSFEWFCV